VIWRLRDIVMPSTYCDWWQVLVQIVQACKAILEATLTGAAALPGVAA
jgi:hypothetical protein